MKTRRKKGGILIEVMIAAVILGIITAALLHLYDFGHTTALESREVYVASNTLDTLMSYFEDYFAVRNRSNFEEHFIFASHTLPPYSQTDFTLFADSSSLGNFEILRADSTHLLVVLNQLEDWRIQYKLFFNGLTNFTTIPEYHVVYGDVILVLNLQWHSRYRNTQREEEIVSVFPLPLG